MKYENLSTEEQFMVDTMAELWVELGGNEEDFIVTIDAIKERIYDKQN